jgi:hypothetical protein
MAELLLDHLRMGSLLDQQGRACVPEIVDSHVGWQPSSPEGG